MMARLQREEPKTAPAQGPFGAKPRTHLDGRADPQAKNINVVSLFDPSSSNNMFTV